MSRIARHPGFWSAFLLVSSTLAALFGTRAEADEAKPLLAIVSIKIPDKSGIESDAVEKLVSAGLSNAGWNLVGTADTNRLLRERRQIDSCQSDACLFEVTRATGAEYVLRAEFMGTKSRYLLTLSIFDVASPEKPMETEVTHCLKKGDGCQAFDKNVTFAATVVGRKVMMALKNRPAAAPISTEPGTSTGTQAGRQTLATSAAAPRPATEVPPSAIDLNTTAAKPIRTSLILGGAVVGVGVGLMVVSGWYFHKNGMDADCDTTTKTCYKFYDTTSRAYATGVTGFIMAGLGTTYLILELGSKGHETTVAVVPNGLLLGGKF
jgi:hypothetical protein